MAAGAEPRPSEEARPAGRATISEEGVELDALWLAIGSLLLRPYVFVFLAMSLVVSSCHLGYQRTAILFGLAWGIAFLSEFSSTRTGFPYGYYEYLDATRGRELWIANVPFFDSLSYTFIAYAAYSMALLVYTPVLRRGADVQLVETHRTRQAWPVALLTVVFFVGLDIVIDPVAVRGSRWFLGQIFWYPEGGLYFGVPLSNFGGWAIVGAAIVVLFQRLDRALVKRGWMCEAGVRHVPAKALWGPALYYLLLTFNLTIAFAIDEPLLGWVGIFLFAPVTIVLLVLVSKPAQQATADDIEAHFGDFPRSPLRAWWPSLEGRKGRGGG
jgi:putative membrane protein